jgi:hypothetical protein
VNCSRSRVLFASGPSFTAVACQVPTSMVKVHEGGSILQVAVRRPRDMRFRYFRCDDAGHMAVGCRNALTYFKCRQLWHISSFCRSITLLPSSSSLLHLSSSSTVPPPVHPPSSLPNISL